MLSPSRLNQHLKDGGGEAVDTEGLVNSERDGRHIIIITKR